MSDDVLVRVENVSKRFCRSLKRSLWYGLQDLGSEISGRRHGGGCGLPQTSADVQLRQDEFWAVKDASIELRRGECMGLIGRNGAGKTTLLRILNGLIKPDTGKIEMKGRIGALIALGAGFNPVLTGRENIYTNGSILGLSAKQIDGKIEEIVEFAEINEFIDSPVQSYSSGMQVRLGFAVATALQPDILLIDEVLAVGDLPFRAKSYKKLGEIMKQTAVIVVSHNEAQIQRLCQKSVYLAGGEIVFYGDTPQTFEAYNRDNNPSLGESAESSRLIKSDFIRDCKVLPYRLTASTGGRLSTKIHLDVLRPISISSISIHFSKAGEFVCHAVHDNRGHPRSLDRGINILEMEIENLPLSSGVYMATLIIFTNTDKDIVVHYSDVCRIDINGRSPSSSCVSIPLDLITNSHEDSQS